MNKYISNVRGRDSGMIYNISQSLQRMKNKLKKHDKVPEDIPHDRLHVIGETSFEKRVFEGKNDEEKKELMEEINSEPEEVKEEIREIEDEYDTLERVEQNVEQKKEGLFSKFMRLFKRKPKSEDENIPLDQVNAVMEGRHIEDVAEEKEEMHEMEEVAKHEKQYVEVDDIDEVKDDLKKMSKITLAIMQHLPKEDQAMLKNTSDFHEYKELLEKYGFVK